MQTYRESIKETTHSQQPKRYALKLTLGKEPHNKSLNKSPKTPRKEIEKDTGDGQASYAHREVAILQKCPSYKEQSQSQFFTVIKQILKCT